MKIVRFLQGIANNLMWFTNISLGAGLLAAIGITIWYTESENGWALVKGLREMDDEKEEA